jgi:hypothetical protein
MGKWLEPSPSTSFAAGVFDTCANVIGVSKHNNTHAVVATYPDHRLIAIPSLLVVPEVNALC